jgi:DNA-directed RNA polymerase subunit M
MEFCSACGSRMVPKKIEGSRLLQLICPRCEKTLKKIARLPSELVKVHHSPKQFIAVIDRKENLSTLPTINAECPSCGNNKAYVWMVQTRGTDESSTQFMGCVECNFTFRENT